MLRLPLLKSLEPLSIWKTLTPPLKHQHVDTFVLLYDQGPLEAPVRFKQILSRIRQQVRYHPRFQQIYRAPLTPFSAPSWSLDENFNAEYHVRHIALPKPGDWRQFCIQVARLHSRDLDSTRPLWEINVIEGLDQVPGLAPGHFALVCKIHNSLMTPEIPDLLWNLQDQAQTDPALSSPKPASPLTMIDTLLGITRHSCDLALRPLTEPLGQAGAFAGRQWSELRPLVRLVGRGVTGHRRVPYSRFNTNVSSFRVWEGCFLPLDAFNDLLNRLPQVTENDLLLTVIGSAMRDYLCAQGELRNRMLWSLAPLEGQIGESTGHTEPTYTISQLATDQADPLARLASISHWRRERCAPAAQQPLREAPLSTLSPLQNMSFANRELHRHQRTEAAGAPLYNTALIGFNTGSSEHSLLGAPLVYCSGVPEITDGLGLVHLASRHGDKLVLTFTSCREMLPDPEHYRKCIQHSFNQLLQAVDDNPDLESSDAD
ncbi:DUF1298 domain-containing protein [Motiliproteus coralliicola]|uniref:DUF1298 domain-containing protein n=1 Tax=Motiliproteus coralliicola TaxID=2283196 RepID=A0A369WQL5_9GAMM|nr:wax ester/triacylglycerol synthase domain-containing protein [Motiliproteus coralliicola]RDE24378.1 DUF1298 domain-containing protein [Motiliproteus coralliicola]